MSEMKKQYELVTRLKRKEDISVETIQEAISLIEEIAAFYGALTSKYLN